MIENAEKPRRRKKTQYLVPIKPNTETTRADFSARTRKGGARESTRGKDDIV